MIVIELLNFLTNLFSGTNFNFTFDGAWITSIMEILNFVSWVIPLDVIITCFNFSIVFIIFRIVVALWKLIPFT